jgi:hypothetical protein
VICPKTPQIRRLKKLAGRKYQAC